MKKVFVQNVEQKWVAIFAQNVEKVKIDTLYSAMAPEELKPDYGAQPCIHDKMRKFVHVCKKRQGNIVRGFEEAQINDSTQGEQRKRVALNVFEYYWHHILFKTMQSYSILKQYKELKS